MKKTLKFIGLIAMAAVLFSCEKKNIDTPVKNPQETETPSDLSQLDPSKYLLSFGATIESPATKATIDFEEDLKEAKVTFDKNDEVLVVSGTETATYHFDGTQFIPNQPESPLAIDENGMTVYYPSSEFSVSESTVTFSMPGPVEDLEDLGKKAPMAAQIVQDGDSFKAVFKNICSVLQVNVTADVNINSVMLNFGDSNKYAEGAKFNIGWNDKNPTMAVSEQASTSGVTVEVTTPAKTAEAFFILPTVALSEGLEVQANLAANHNGGTNIYTIKNASTDVPVRNRFSKMSFYAGLFSGGTGTSGDPYKIATARDFRNLITYSSKGCPQCSKNASDFLGANYLQTANIDFKKVKMSPIGDSDHQFSGQYDGYGNKLQNVNINETGQFAGIFAYANGSAEIKNITVSGSIEKTGTTDNSCVGSIVGIVRGAATVTGCTNNATVTSSATYTGGIVGRLYDSTAEVGISKCTNNGNVTATTPNLGGIVGQQTGGGNISGCTNSGAVSGTSIVGGIAGIIVGGAIEYCSSAGDVTGTENYVGGLVGQVGNGSAHVQVHKCRVNANVSGAGQGTGGIAGIIRNGVLNTCFAKGTVTSSLYDIGGIVGIAWANGSSATNRPYIYDCIAANSITCTRTSGAANIGGVIGRLLRTKDYTGQYAAVHNCIGLNQEITVTNNLGYAGAFVGFVNSNHNTNYDRIVVSNCISLVTDDSFHMSTSTANIGGFVGNYAGRINHCYYLVSTNNQAATANRSIANELTKSDLETLTSSEFCEAHNTRALTDSGDYRLYVNGVKYQSSGWILPSDCSYPVPTTLYNLGSDYYK